LYHPPTRSRRGAIIAYSPPPVWNHGDIPTAALLQTYSDSLNAIYAILGDDNTEPAIEELRDGKQAIFIHRFRWLHFRDGGTMRQYGGTEDTQVALTADANENKVMDLDTISWLTYGMLYEVEGVKFVFEHRNP
jgi:hypothetical protein